MFPNLAEGADVNAKDDIGLSALSVAAISESEDARALLLSYGAKVSPRDSGKRTPLYYAAHNGHARIVEMLVEAGANVNAKDMAENCRKLPPKKTEPHMSQII